MYKFYYTNGYGVTSYIRKSMASLWQTTWKPNIRKWIMRINLTCLMLLIAFMQVSLASNAQKISLSKRNAALTEVFRELKKQSGYGFMINREQIKLAKLVTINATGDDLEKVLDKLFEGQPFSYKLEGKLIVVVDRKPEPVRIDLLQIDVKGLVIDENGKILEAASVSIKGSNRKTATNENGEFSFSNVDENAILVISFIGYETKEISATADIGTIRMEISTGKLDEVSVTVYTGYQTLLKERATGSLVLINKNIIERNTKFNILDRLNGVASGLILNAGLPTQGGANNAKLSIHGRSTIFANAEPLIVLDGIPYEGNIDQISSMDIESITILKDAAAASIWGTRASNGVIVLTSKIGKINSKAQIQFSGQFSLFNKHDIYYNPSITSSDYIDLEQFLFNKGFYNGTINNGYSALSPAVEIFDAVRKKNINTKDSINYIGKLKDQDIKSQLAQYLYRQKQQQQYYLNISGGTEKINYYISGTLQKSLENLVSDASDQFVITNRNSYSLAKGLSLNSDISLSESNTYSKTDSYTPYTPYDKIADEFGNTLVVTSGTSFRNGYIDTAGKGKLLDWHYRPLDEFSPNATTKQLQYKIGLGLSYNLNSDLMFQLNYQRLINNRNIERNYGLDRYYTRNFINKYSLINNDILTQYFPTGEILELNSTAINSNTYRGQINFNKQIGQHHLIIIGGYEQQELRRLSTAQNIYGYDPDTRLNKNATVDATKLYRFYYAPQQSDRINTSPSMSYYINFSQSYYSNLTYTFRNRYIFSASIRKDESNLFGVESNQKGVPLWSLGLSWRLTGKGGLNLAWLNEFKLRTTYGYNGNVDKSVSGLLTFRNSGLFNNWGSNYSRIASPLNPFLTWEQVANINFGIDFSMLDNRIAFSGDFYQKKAKDLIGNLPIAAQSGLTEFRGNGATILTKGVDLTFNTVNLKGNFTWFSTLLVSYNLDKVTDYKTKQSNNNAIITQNFNNPLTGYPYYAIYSFPSAGLDQKGMPQGFLKGAISKDYTTIINQLDPLQIKYHGSASPVWFGSLLNSFGYKNLELSFNILFKFQYYFKRTNIFSGSVYNTLITDFDKRWQKPGDENYTNIPALIYPNNSSMNTFFQSSSDLVERGDHIRLKDLRLSYRFKNKNLLFKDIKCYIHANNLGIIWRENNKKIDPDVGTVGIPEPFNTAIGLNINF